MADRRSTSERIEHAVGRLRTDDSIWIATGSSDGVPHMVPVSLAWDGTRVLVVTRDGTPTVRNAVVSGRARLALDSTEDVVVFDADVSVASVPEVDESTIERYVESAGWDPRAATGNWSMLLCTPTRMQVWNSQSEMRGRTVMSDGRWRSGSGIDDDGRDAGQ